MYLNYAVFISGFIMLGVIIWWGRSTKTLISKCSSLAIESMTAAQESMTSARDSMTTAIKWMEDAQNETEKVRKLCKETVNKMIDNAGKSMQTSQDHVKNAATRCHNSLMEGLEACREFMTEKSEALQKLGKEMTEPLVELRDNLKQIEGDSNENFRKMEEHVNNKSIHPTEEFLYKTFKAYDKNGV